MGFRVLFPVFCTVTFACTLVSCRSWAGKPGEKDIPHSFAATLPMKPAFVAVPDLVVDVLPNSGSGPESAGEAVHWGVDLGNGLFFSVDGKLGFVAASSQLVRFPERVSLSRRTEQGEKIHAQASRAGNHFEIRESVAGSRTSFAQRYRIIELEREIAIEAPTSAGPVRTYTLQRTGNTTTIYGACLDEPCLIARIVQLPTRIQLSFGENSPVGRVSLEQVQQGPHKGVVIRSAERLDDATGEAETSENWGSITTRHEGLDIWQKKHHMSVARVNDYFEVQRTSLDGRALGLPSRVYVTAGNLRVVSPGGFGRELTLLDANFVGSGK